jgi:hypothetical protein
MTGWTLVAEYFHGAGERVEVFPGHDIHESNGARRSVALTWFLVKYISISPSMK